MACLFSLSGQPATVNLVVKPASSFPLDVYFLIDYSFSMVDEIRQVTALARQTGQRDVHFQEVHRTQFGCTSL